jgi:hypothetical protein
MTIFPGVRLNFSRSGISASIGLRGASVTVGPNGSALNLGIPGTGLSFRQRLGGNGAEASPEPPPQVPLVPELPVPGVPQRGTAIESAPVSEVTSTGLQGLKDLIRQASDERAKLRGSIPVAREELETARKRLRRAQNWFFGLFLKNKIPERTTAVSEKEAELKQQEERLAGSFIDADFALDEATSAAFDALSAAFEQVAACSRIWDVTTKGNEDRVRTRSYASTWVDRKPVVFGPAQDEVLQSGTKVLKLQNANGADLLVYPAFFMMAEPQDIALIDVREIEVRYSKSRFVEEDGLPPDAEVVDHTWKKCNKDGSPDRRFGNNYQIPVAGYGEITLSSRSGLHEQYMFSSAEKAQRFAEALAEYQSSVRALGPGASDGGNSSGTPALLAEAAENSRALRCLESLRNATPVSGEHASKVVERFAHEFKADLEALNGTTTAQALEDLVHQVAAIPGIMEKFLGRAPTTAALRDAALNGTTGMVRDAVAQICAALERSGTDPEGAKALAVAREAEAALGKRKGNAPNKRHTRKRTTTFSGFDLGFTVAGLTHDDRQQIVRERVKDGDKLLLRRDPANEYDPNAIEVLLDDGTQLGFVPAKKDVTGNREEGKTLVDLARAMDRGARYELSCHRVFSLEGDPSILLVYAVGRAYAVS